MKIRLIKLICLSGVLVGMAGLSSCVKSRGGTETDFSNLQDFVIFQTGGLVNYNSASVSGTLDTANLSPVITFASKNVASSPLNVTIGVDDTKRTDYNSANGTNFQAMPTNAYKIITPTVTIPAGQSYAQPKIQIYPKKLDPSISYMLAISITDASGKSLSGNLNTLYYHIIGNPIAGNYTEEWIRWNASDTSGAPTYHFAGDLNQFVPESATQVYVESVDNGAGFHISFTNTAGTLSNFKVTLDASTWSNFGATSIDKAPVFEIADPVHGVYRIFFQYEVGTSPRSIVEQFVKQ